MLFLSAIEDHLWYEGAVAEPWVGVMHQVPRHHYNFPDLTRLFASSQWLESAPHCKGIFVLCDYVRRFLREQLPTILISTIPYPQDVSAPQFSWDMYRRARNVLQVGEFLRNHQAFFDLDAGHCTKILLGNEEIRSQF